MSSTQLVILKLASVVYTKSTVDPFSVVFKNRLIVESSNFAVLFVSLNSPYATVSAEILPDSVIFVMFTLPCY